MTLEPARIAKLLRDAGADEFSICARKGGGVMALVGEDPGERVTSTSSVAVTVHVDRRAGRGSSRVVLDPRRDVRAQLVQAVARAEAAMGPSWRLPRPAAPARVRTRDRDWAEAPRDSLRAVAAHASRALPRSARLTQAVLALDTSELRVLTSSGYDNRNTWTRLHFTGQLLAEGGSLVPLHLRTCHRQELALQELFDGGARESLALAKASALQPGFYDLVLDLEAYAPTQARDFGLWTPITEQARAGRASAGLARFQRGQRVTKSPVRREALDLTSDGTLDYAWRSAPFHDDGAPVRRFSLVRDGAAANLALSSREAALRGRVPNGGIRNLVVGTGSHSAEELRVPDQRPVLFVHSLSSWQCTARGDIRLEISQASLIEQRPQGPLRAKAIRGGLVVNNLFSLLARARYSRETAISSWCQGPRALRLDRVLVRP